MLVSNELLRSIQRLDADGQIELLEYTKKLSKPSASKERYRREALKQIRDAISAQT